MSNLTPGWFKERVALAEEDIAKWPEWLKCSYQVAKLNYRESGNEQPDTRRAENATGAQENGVMRTEQPDDCRKAFEDWHGFTCFDRNHEGKYEIAALEKKWKIWEAGWNALGYKS